MTYISGDPGMNERTGVAVSGFLAEAADAPLPEDRQSLSKAEMKMAEFDRLIEQVQDPGSRKNSGQVRKRSGEGEDGKGMS